jgi:hypothetical protein
VEPTDHGARLGSTRAYRDYGARVRSWWWQSGCKGRTRRVRHEFLLLRPAQSSAAAAQRSAGAQAAVCPPGSLRARAEATYEPVIGQRDANGLRHLETNRLQLQHDPPVDVHRALYPLRLRGRRVAPRHPPRCHGPRRPVPAPPNRRTSRRRIASAGLTPPQRLLSATGDPAAALSIRRSARASPCWMNVRFPRG